MTGRRSSRQSDQKGVEAIFTTPKKPGRTRAVFGGMAILAGICLIIVSVIIVQLPRVWDQSPAEYYGSLVFASIGVFTLTCGVGVIISDLQLRSPSSRETSVPTGHVGDTTLRSSSSSLSTTNLRLVLTVFTQGCVLLSLYSGLVDEYQSNPTMQEWVRSSLGNGQYLLNWGALLVSSFLVGILVVYCLVTSDRVE